MKALEKINNAKERLSSISELLNQGKFIEDILRGVDPMLVQRCINNYTELLSQLKFEEEQLKDEIEANKTSIKRYMLHNDMTRLNEGQTTAKITKRSSYNGSRAEDVLRDKGLLEQAIAEGAIEYSGPTVKATKLSPEMREALEGVVKYSYSMTVK